MLKRLILFTVLVCSLSIGFVACSEEVEYDSTTVYLDPPGGDAEAEVEPVSESTLQSLGDMKTGDKFGGTLKVAAQASLETLDTSFSGAYVVTTISAHVWERLFERDAGFNAKPQMVSGWEVDDAGTTYTFTLRDGMTFHDGSSVTSGDVIPSLKRMWETTAAGDMLKGQMVENGWKEIDDKTFSITFQQPMGVVITGMAAPWPLSNIWPEHIANTPAQEDYGQEGAIGSGPYKVSEWVRGDKLVVERFDAYVPRTDEAGSYLAGGKIAYIDKIEWLEIPSEESKKAALQTGEIDVWDGAGLDFFADMVSDPNIDVAKYEKHFWTYDFNVTSTGPASNKIIRQALQAATDIEALAASLGPSDLWSLCPSRYRCGTPLASTVGEEYYNENDVEKAKKMIAESGYNGETFLLMNPNDYATITPMGQVLKPLFEEVGLTVEMPSMDWATLLSRLPDPDWDAITDWWVQWASPDPVADPMLSGTLYFGNFGDDPEVERTKALRLAYAFEPDAAKQMELIGQMQLALYDSAPQVMLAQWASIYPYSTVVKDFDVPVFPVYINAWLDR